MKSVLAVILIGFLALSHGLICIFPFICDEEPVLGSIICDSFCSLIGAGGGSCESPLWPYQPVKCTCAGLPKSGLTQDIALNLYNEILIPTACEAACKACKPNSEGTGPYIVFTTSAVSAMCTCT